MFIVVFVIMLPIYLQTNDPLTAWEAGLAWAFIIGVHRPDRRLRRPVHPQVHAARGDARHARGHLDRVHLDAAGVPDVGGALDRLRRFGIILIGLTANVRLPGDLPVGLAALLVGTAIAWIGVHARLVRLHGRRRRSASRSASSAFACRCFDRRAQGPGRHLAAAGDRDPARRLQLHRGHEQRRERRRRRRQLQPAPHPGAPTASARSSARCSAARSRPRSTSAIRAGRRSAAGSATRWRPAS